MNKKSILKVVTFIMLIFIVVTVYRQVVTKEHLFVSGDVTQIERWTYNDKIIENSKLDVSKNEVYTIEANFHLEAEKYLLLRSSLSNIHIAVDNNVIYTDAYEREYFFKSPMASLWHLVEIPVDGKQVSVTYQSPYDKMSGLISPIVYGDRGDLLFYLFDAYGAPFIIDGLILFLGLLMIIIAFINPKELFNSIGLIGVFSVLVSFWLLAESKMIQFFSGNEWLIGSMAYISLALIPIPLIFYIKSFVSEENKKYFKYYVSICWINFLIIVTLQVFDIKDFFDTLFLTHGFMLVFILLTLRMLYFEIKVKKNHLAKQFVKSLTVLFVFILIDLYRFYAIDGSNITLYVRLGLMTFILLLGIESTKQLIQLLKKSYKASFYEQLAYLDQLTQGPNRTAFEKDLETIFDDPLKLSSLRLVILDMNKLKDINDIYGHVTGDEAIKLSYNLIDKYFKYLGKTYRIGGDEFACIITDNDEEAFNKSCQLFNDSIEATNTTLNYPFGIALGSVAYDPLQDTAVKKMMHRADINMYEAKQQYRKSIS